jgi:predicted Na+-dependent transporter
MHFMNDFNRFAGKWMPLLVFGCLCAGITFAEPIGRLTLLVPFLFAFMTFTGTLNSTFRQLLNIAKNPLPLFVSLLIIHIVMPLLALGAGKLFFPGGPYFIVGIVLEFVVPSAVACFMWSTIAGGNSALTLSIVLLDTLAAPFLVPFSLHVLVGAKVAVDVAGMMRDLVWMIAVPALATMLLNQFTDGRAGKKLSPLLAPYGKIALLLIIMINSTRVAPFIRHMTPMLFGIAGLIFVLAVTGYFLGWLCAFLLRQRGDVTASMTFGCGMRNISAGAVIAAAYFPAEVMFPVMIGTLFQQMLASVFAHFLTRNRKTENTD